MKRSTFLTMLTVASFALMPTAFAAMNVEVSKERKTAIEKSERKTLKERVAERQAEIKADAKLQVAELYAKETGIKPGIAADFATKEFERVSGENMEVSKVSGSDILNNLSKTRDAALEMKKGSVETAKLGQSMEELLDVGSLVLEARLKRSEANKTNADEKTVTATRGVDKFLQEIPSILKNGSAEEIANAIAFGKKLEENLRSNPKISVEGAFAKTMEDIYTDASVRKSKWDLLLKCK